jgi:NAD(P)-dependent dehydrogenase (short-subunit alcohol dehydrogenase family)
MALEIDLTGRSVLITGGTKGVGRGIAQRFSDAGATVIVCARREAENPLPADWHFISADLRDGDAAYAAVDAAFAVAGRLDCVVNNAGGTPPADSAEAPPTFTQPAAASLITALITKSSTAALSLTVIVRSAPPPQPRFPEIVAGPAGAPPSSVFTLIFPATVSVPAPEATVELACGPTATFNAAMVSLNPARSKDPSEFNVTVRLSAIWFA